MNTSSAGLQVAYGVHLPVVVGAAPSPQKHGDLPRNALRDDEPLASTRVRISAEGQSLLASTRQAELSAASVSTRDTPVAAPQENTAARNETNLTAGGSVVQAEQNTFTPATFSASLSAGVPQTAQNAAPAGAADSTPETRQEARLDAAQSRQDDGPALAQSGIRDNREIFAP
jgi:hypothetical protein